jgi:hypothetical protein
VPASGDCEINRSNGELVMKGVSKQPQVAPTDTPSELIAQDACEMPEMFPFGL